jgi:polyribonucleotide nucleotidyltransferase
LKNPIDLGDGRTITLQTGKLARQADGAVLVKMGRTMLLATVVSATEAGKMLILCLFRLNTRRNSHLLAGFPVVL